MNLFKQKKAISIRISEDVLAWFKDHNHGGYQTAINEVLESYVQTERNRSHRMAGRGQEIFRKYYAQCFWHLKQDLEITPQNIYIVIEGLNKLGGREGMIVAKQLTVDR